MNDDEKELLKVGAETAMKPFADLINKLFGGPVEQIGGMWTDGLVARRQIRQLKLMKKVQRAIEDAGFEPQGIPDNLWVSSVQAALLEDDENVQDAWANLLANAADPRQRNKVAPSFPSILKELSPHDAKLIQTLYQSRLTATDSPNTRGSDVGFEYSRFLSAYSAAGISRRPNLGMISHGDMDKHGESIKADLQEAETAKDLLIRCGLLQNVTAIKPVKINAKTSQVVGGTRTQIPQSLDVEYATNLRFTRLGLDFVRACQSPQRES